MAHSSWHILALTGDTADTLDTATANLVSYLVDNPQIPVAAVAHALQSERPHKTHRRVILCQSTVDALHALEAQQQQRVLTSVSRASAPKVTFLFPGLGDQYVNMAAQLYREEPRFRVVVDQCCELLLDPLGLDLRDVIYPKDAHDEPIANHAAESTLTQSPSTESAPIGKIDLRQMVGRGGPQRDLGRLKETAIAQPALFAIEYALAELWRSWGVKPAAMVGYSLGEYVAATQAGVFTLAESLQIVAHRARLIDELPVGAMLAVGLPEERVRPYLNAHLSLSAINGPLMCVVAGSVAAVAALEQQLTAERVACRQIQTTHAFHSYMMQPAGAPLQLLIETFKPNFPQIPFVSNVTGKWITPQQATDPAYWAAHMCQPVRFADALNTLWARPNHILLEVGLGQTLGGLAMQHPARRTVENPLILPSLPSTHTAGAERFHLLRALGQLWMAGVEVDWQGVCGETQPTLMPVTHQQMDKEPV